jgi:prophage DNA circulation protein
MSDEIQEIERLIKQIGELGESLVRLTRKLQEQNLQRFQNYQNDSANLVASERKRTGEPSYSDAARGEIGSQCDYAGDYAKARRAVLDGTMTPQEAAVDLLCAAVADKSMTLDQAASEIAKLLRPDLPVSRRIAIREDLKTAFEAGDDVVSRIRPFLKNSIEQAEQRRKVHERTLAPAGMNPI